MTTERVLITQRYAAAVLGVTTRTIRRMMARGDLTFIKFGEHRASRVRIYRDSLAAYIARKTVPTDA